MDPIVVRSEEDIPKVVEFGTQFIIDPFPGPEEEDQFITDEMFAERTRLQQIIAERIPGPALEEDGDQAVIEATFSETHISFKSTADQVVKVAGDVRDGTVKMPADKWRKRRLTDEGHGFVEITDEGGNDWRFNR